LKLLKRIPYWQLIAIPVLSMFLGAASNQVVFIANGGAMPVQLNAANIQRFSENSVVVNGRTYLDPRHSVLRDEDHLKVLADIFNFGNSVASVGDLLLDFGSWSWQYGPIMWFALAFRKLIGQS
jgi:hypothetical protein